MSAADVGIGGPPAPRWRETLVARLQARRQAISTRLRAGMARLLAQDDGALAAWAAAFAKAPQAVPDLPPPQNKRLMRFIVGFVVGAHVALLLALYWRSSPPPPPQAEMTVELVREMPEPPKPKPPEAKEPPKPVPLQPGNEKAKAEGRKSNPASQQGNPEQKAKPEDKKAEEKPKADEKKSEQTKAEQPKPEQKPKVERQTHQRQAHRAPPRQEPLQQQAQAKQAPAQEQPRPAPREAQHDTPPAMAAVALPGASDAGTDVVSYQQLVLSQVAKAKKQGRHMGVPGYAGVRFRVGEDGSLEMVKLVVSSGDPTLDSEAEAMIRRAAPFPKPPPGGRRDYGITLVFAAQP